MDAKQSINEFLNSELNMEAASDAAELLTEMPVFVKASPVSSLNARPLKRQKNYFSASNGDADSDTTHVDNIPLNFIALI